MEPRNLETLKNEIRDILDVSTESYRADTLTMIGGEVPDVVVQIKRNKVTVSVHSTKLDMEDDLVVCPLPIASLNWRRIPKDELLVPLASLIATARLIRKSNHRKCRYCPKVVAPEYLDDDEACWICAREILGKLTVFAERRYFETLRRPG